MGQFNNISNKLLSVEELLFKLPKWKREGKVVFTNGCFDILHLGHLDFLGKASKLGHKLIVGLNTDTSVKRLKGTSRPINNEQARAMMLTDLAMVDAVVFLMRIPPTNSFSV